MAIETLLLTGANNHDWQRSAPFCKQLLEERGPGLFRLHKATQPSEALADRKAACKYQLFFVDYNGPSWNPAAQANFTDAVRGGTGVCILHAANNAFPGWKEYEEMCALLWRAGTGHGAYHRFDIRITDNRHPVTRGLPPVLKNHPDELYHRLVHLHRAPYRAIAVAHSSTESGGTGREEPVVVVKRYGQGRVFHCILGHVWTGGGLETFENPDFQKILVRGCEWAATGTVTD